MGVGIYRAYRFWLKRIFRLGCSIQYIGVENIIKDGPLIVASNHTSYFDPLALGTTYKRPLSFMARKSLFENSFFSWIIRNVFAFPVDRGAGSSKSALRAFCKRLDQDRAVVIFPEGTRSVDGKLQPMQAGTAMLAVRSGAPIQPVYVMGTVYMWPRGQRLFKFRPLRVYVGEAIYPKKNIARSEKKSEQERITNELYASLKNLEERAWHDYPVNDYQKQLAFQCSEQ